MISSENHQHLWYGLNESTSNFIEVKKSKYPFRLTSGNSIKSISVSTFHTYQLFNVHDWFEEALETLIFNLYRFDLLPMKTVAQTVCFAISNVRKIHIIFTSCQWITTLFSCNTNVYHFCIGHTSRIVFIVLMQSLYYNGQSVGSR